MTLSWIDSDKLEEHIKALESAISDAFKEAAIKRQKNVVDPFASLMLAKNFSLQDSHELDNLQNTESGLRGMSKAIGDFHQKILASVKGWENHDAGYDLRCPSRKILAELKNKHNTMNASNARKVEEELETAIRQNRGWKGYLVKIIPKSAERYEKEIKKGVYETDGVSFYEIVTGEPNALHDLFDYLCDNSKISPTIKSHCRDIMEKSLPPPRR